MCVCVKPRSPEPGPRERYVHNAPSQLFSSLYNKEHNISLIIYSKYLDCGVVYNLAHKNSHRERWGLYVGKTFKSRHALRVGETTAQGDIGVKD